MIQKQWAGSFILRWEYSQKTRVELIRSQDDRQTHDTNLDNADVVVVGGRGLGSKENFRLVFKLADLLEGEVGATRPAILAGWAGEDRASRSDRKER